MISAKEARALLEEEIAKAPVEQLKRIAEAIVEAVSARVSSITIYESLAEHTLALIREMGCNVVKHKSTKGDFEPDPKYDYYTISF